ncbi:unnamed protein product [Arctia plantaginis]|uniref:Uncharacterized protein n=1 Tax=Arctia plantaginis TaxID=874455 RepID=A0A8S0ZFG8_ARCPL|nr:unnamed protein product [Arctia plantaginis]
MHVSFTNILWYLEFGAFAVLLMAFFCWFVYIAKINYVKYNPRFDYKKRYMADGGRALRGRQRTCDSELLVYMGGGCRLPPGAPTEPFPQIIKKIIAFILRSCSGTSQASVTSPRFRNVKEAQALLPVTCAFKEALLQYTADLNLNAENATTFTGRSCGH